LLFPGLNVFNYNKGILYLLEMETNTAISKRSTFNYQKLSNGDVRIGGLLITNRCADGTSLNEAINWIVLDRQGNLYLDSQHSTSEYQRELCIYKKVNNAEGIAAFIGKHRHKIKKIQLRMKVYRNVIQLDHPADNVKAESLAVY
jgi:hypothetical protein